MMWHLVKRALTSFSNSSPVSIESATQILLPEEMLLWKAMQGRDQKHSLHVLRRFQMFYPGGSRAENAAALLHDVGKLQSDLGWLSRIAVSVIGGRTERFREYIEHESIGSNLLRGISEQITVDLVAGDSVSPAGGALRRADEI